VPIYDFKCHKCGKVSEIFVRSAGSQEVSCPDCGSATWRGYSRRRIWLRREAHPPEEPAVVEQNAAKLRLAPLEEDATGTKEVTTCKN
jgi:putative FmdB family regulatory protein